MDLDGKIAHDPIHGSNLDMDPQILPLTGTGWDPLYQHYGFRFPSRLGFGSSWEINLDSMAVSGSGSKCYLALAPAPSHIFIGHGAKAVVRHPIQAPEIHQWEVKRFASGSLGKDCLMFKMYFIFAQKCICWTEQSFWSLLEHARETERHWKRKIEREFIFYL